MFRLLTAAFKVGFCAASAFFVSSNLAPMAWGRPAEQLAGVPGRWVALAPAAAVAGRAGQAQKSLLDRVYTDAQAQRGRKVYAEVCSACHGPNLRGGEMAPGLLGKGFLIFWTEVSLGQLFDRIRTTMPDDGPGSLSDQRYIDVLAYLLHENGFPAGNEELTTDDERLKEILIVEAPSK